MALSHIALSVFVIARIRRNFVKLSFFCKYYSEFHYICSEYES